MTAHHPPHGPQDVTEARTAPDPIGDQGGVPGGAQGSSEGRKAIKLRDQIAEALHVTFTNDWHELDASECHPCQVRTESVMAVVQPEIDQLIEIQVTDLQVAASIAQHEQQRAEQAEAEREQLRATALDLVTSVQNERDELLATIARVRAALAERRTEVAEFEAEHEPSGWSDGVTVTCDRIDDALREPATPAAALGQPKETP